jgi:hypothetical protein
MRFNYEINKDAGSVKGLSIYNEKLRIERGAELTLTTRGGSYYISYNRDASRYTRVLAKVETEVGIGDFYLIVYKADLRSIGKELRTKYYFVFDKSYKDKLIGYSDKSDKLSIFIYKDRVVLECVEQGCE